MKISLLQKVSKAVLWALLAAGLAACSLASRIERAPTLVPTIRILAPAPLEQALPLEKKAAVTPESATEQPQVTLASLLVQDSTSPGAIQWEAAPPCQNQPLSREGWQSLLASQPAAAPAGLVGLEQPVTALAVDDPAASELAALELNVASGRLNRATGIELAGLPEVTTVGDLMERLDAGATGEVVDAGRQVQSGQGIVQPVCGRVIFTQFNQQPGEAAWSAQGILAAPQAAAPGPVKDTAVKDTGLVSPDGRLAAFTSLEGEVGGPVFLLDLHSGAWTNLIEAINSRLKGSQPALQDDLWWEIAGWMPDSRRLLLTPADLSAAFLVDLNDFSFRAYAFPGGLGGARIVQLSPDGTRFVFTGTDSAGGSSLNSVDLSSGAVTTLGVTEPGAGFLLYPRFSPDGSRLSYLIQSGHPSTGLTYSINLFAFADFSQRVLVQGNLGQSVPTWSPDGQFIAYTRKEPDEPDIVVPGETPPEMRGNIWVVPVNGGASQQVTFIDGWARSPAWDYDARTLAFVTQDGQVGMVNIDQPGYIWRAAETSAEYPLLTSAFFVP